MVLVISFLFLHEPTKIGYCVFFLILHQSTRKRNHDNFSPHIVTILIPLFFIRMNNQTIFTHFLQNLAGVNIARNRAEIQTYIPDFATLLTISDDEIDEFIKANNAANSSRTPAARIILTSYTGAALKTILFELKDREICGISTDASQLRNINATQMVAWRGERTKFLQEQKELKNRKLPDMKVPTLKPDNF